jgi:hypothetical protein
VIIVLFWWVCLCLVVVVGFPGFMIVSLLFVRLLFVFGDCWWFPRSMMLVCGGFPALSSQAA